VQALGRDVAVDEFLEAGFVDGDFSCLKSVHLALVVIDADDMVADFREAGPRDETDITRTNDAEIHYFYLEC
jgi:hypothetical protein